jgi:hypothetical protein
VHTNVTHGGSYNASGGSFRLAVIDWKNCGEKMRERPFSVAVDFFPLAGQLDGRSNKSNGYIPMLLS